MKKFFRQCFAASFIFLSLPSFVLGAQPTAKNQSLVGVVTKAYENVVVFRTNTAAVYTAQAWQSKLVKRYGAEMKFGEILVGDKVEVKGLVWPDNSINASVIKNMSLYPHTGTFSGKVESLNLPLNSFKLQTTSYGLLNVTSDNLTVFKKNSLSSGITELETGMSVKVKGVWERDRSQLYASQVLASVRLVNIEVEGNLTMVSVGALNVQTSSGSMYIVDISKAKLQNKSGKATSIGSFLPGQTVKVSGKHISGKSQIVGVTVKNKSLP